MPNGEERYVVIDPISKNEYRVPRADLWRITFGAAGLYCSEASRSRTGLERRHHFTECVRILTYGHPTEGKAQRLINLSRFPLDEYLRKHGPERRKLVVDGREIWVTKEQLPEELGFEPEEVEEIWKSLQSTTITVV